MSISRRQFLIYSGLTVSAVAIPSIISSSKRRVINKYNEWKGVTSNQIEELNKYNLDDYAPKGPHLSVEGYKKYSNYLSEFIKLSNKN